MAQLEFAGYLRNEVESQPVVAVAQEFGLADLKRGGMVPAGSRAAYTAAHPSHTAAR